MKHVLLPVITVMAATVLILSCSETDSENLQNGLVSEQTPDVEASELPFPVVELIQARHILISTERPAVDDTVVSNPDAASLAADIRDAIVSGDATFEEMALEYSHCWSATRGGMLPAFTPGGISGEMEQAITDLQPGEISNVVRTRFGYHIFKRVI